MTLARWLLCGFAILAGQSLASGREWRMAVTPHYRVLSQRDDRDTTGWMRRFDQYVLSTSDTLQLDLGALPPLTVVIFDRDKDYDPYKPTRPNGKTANAAGQFVWRRTWSVIGMAGEADSEELRRVLQHEATHWLMSVDQARQPAWFSEGIAEVFSTFERHIEQVSWAKPIGAHLALLQSVRPEPLAQFLIEPGALFDRDERTDRFYAESWAFTHFLLLSDQGARRPLLLKFLKMYKTESGEATVTAVFGPDLKNLERDFHLYIDQRSFNYMAMPLKPAADPPALQPAPAERVEAALGFLALGAERYELARQHAQKAIAIDATAPEGHQILAYVAVENHENAEATRHAEAAVDFGTHDSEIYRLLGDSYASGANAQIPDAAKARANQYEHAINLNPRQLSYYERLAEALTAIDKPREEDAQFLTIGLKLFPGADWVRVGSAAVDFRLGHHDAAMTTLDAVLRPESTLDPSQRAYAAKLRITWLLQTMSSELQDAVSKKDFAAARGVITGYRERIGDDADAAAYLDDVTKSLEVPELMAKYSAARQANNGTEARTLAEQLLARPNLPGNLRVFLEKELHGSGAIGRKTAAH